MLTESGRLFVPEDEGYSEGYRENQVLEVTQEYLCDIGPIDCMSYIIKDKYSLLIVGCKNGKIYVSDTNTSSFREIGNHELEDGSKITKVHEICVIYSAESDCNA